MTAADAFRTAFTSKDFAPAAAVLADDVVFRSPVLEEPWRTRPVVEQLGPAMVEVLDDVTFTQQQGDVLVFEGPGLEGALLLETGDDGKVEAMAIFIRPLPALIAVAKRMGALVDPALLATHRTG